MVSVCPNHAPTLLSASTGEEVFRSQVKTPFSRNGCQDSPRQVHKLLSSARAKGDEDRPALYAT